MSVIVELTIPREGFTLGQAIGAIPEMDYELQHIVPIDDRPIPYLLAHGENTSILEENLRGSSIVRALTVVDHVGDWTLYRIDWTAEYEGILATFAALDVTTLEARGNGTWYFRLWFPGHNEVGHFYNYTRERGLPVHVERVYSLTEESIRGRQFDLTPEQREALVLALEHGYFETPKETTLADVAEELEISRQALSDRIRRGTNQILSNVLLSSADDYVDHSDK